MHYGHRDDIWGFTPPVGIGSQQWNNRERVHWSVRELLDSDWGSSAHPGVQGHSQSATHVWTAMSIRDSGRCGGYHRAALWQMM